MIVFIYAEICNAYSNERRTRQNANVFAFESKTGGSAKFDSLEGST